MPQRWGIVNDWEGKAPPTMGGAHAERMVLGWIRKVAGQAMKSEASKQYSSISSSPGPDFRSWLLPLPWLPPCWNLIRKYKDKKPFPMLLLVMVFITAAESKPGQHLYVWAHGHLSRLHLVLVSFDRNANSWCIWRKSSRPRSLGEPPIWWSFGCIPSPGVNIK